jgi:hypothetical protein
MEKRTNLLILTIIWGTIAIIVRGQVMTKQRNRLNIIKSNLFACSKNYVFSDDS